MGKTAKLKDVVKKTEHVTGMLHSKYCYHSFTMRSSCALLFVEKAYNYIIDHCMKNRTPNFIGTIALFAKLNPNYHMYIPACVTCPSCCIIQLDAHKGYQKLEIKILPKRSMKKKDYTEKDRADLILKLNPLIQQSALMEKKD